MNHVYFLLLENMLYWLRLFSSKNAKNLLQTPHPCEAGRACVLDGQKELESLGSFPRGMQGVIKKIQSPLQNRTIFFIKNPFVSLNCILSGGELLPPPERHSAEVWSHARLALPLWLLGRSDPGVWSPPSFSESPGWGCRRRREAGRCVGAAPLLGKEAMLLDLFAGHLHVTGDPRPREVSFFTQRDTIHALKVTGIFGLCISTRPKDYGQIHSRGLFSGRRRSACQPSLGKDLFAEWWIMRI